MWLKGISRPWRWRRKGAWLFSCPPSLQGLTASIPARATGPWGLMGWIVAHLRRGGSTNSCQPSWDQRWVLRAVKQLVSGEVGQQGCRMYYIWALLAEDMQEEVLPLSSPVSCVKWKYVLSAFSPSPLPLQSNITCRLETVSGSSLYLGRDMERACYDLCGLVTFLLEIHQCSGWAVRYSLLSEDLSS